MKQKFDFTGRGGSFLVLSCLLIFILFFSSFTLALEDEGSTVIDFEYEKITEIRNYSINGSTNSTDIWETNIGDLDDVNSTQFDEGSGGVLTLLTSYIDTFWCKLTGCTLTGNITAPYFNGKFNWTSGDDWNSFDGNTLLFNDSKLATVYYNATQAQNVSGVIDGGSINDTQHPDGNYDGVTLNFSEVASSPGLDMRMNFTGIDNFSRGIIRYRTTELKGEHPVIQFWDYDEEAWEDYPILASSESFATITQPVFDDSGHIDGGVVQMRIYKSSNGNTQNHYYVDWVAISKGFGVPSGEETDPLSWKRNVHDFGNFTTDGYVGINTSTPEKLLDVRGEANINSGAVGNIALTTTGIADINNFRIGEVGGGKNRLESRGGNAFEFLSNGEDIYFNTASGDLYVNDSVLFVNGTSGNVGIGTDSPTEVLDVKGNLNLASGAYIKFGGANVLRHVTAGLSLQGNTLYGGSANSNNLLLQSTSASTKGLINIGDGSLVVNESLGYVGIGTTSPNYTFSVGSTDASDEVSIYHDNSNAYFRTDDGGFNFITDEGTNTNTYLRLEGKGTGYGRFEIYDQDEAEYMRFYTSNGVGNIDMIGTDPGVLTFQTAAHDGVGMFGGAEAGETQELKIYGYRTGDQKRSLDIGVGTDANDTASFDGVSNYFFDGNVTATTDVCVGSNCLSNMGGSSGWNTTGPYTYLSNASGYVGIGTSTPSKLLHLQGGDAIINDTISELYFVEHDQTDENMLLRLSGQKFYFITTNDNLGAHANLMTLDLPNDRVGIGTTSPNYTFSVGSTDASDEVSIYHDNSNAYFRTDDGGFNFITDEGTNTNTYLRLEGKGTGYGRFEIYDQDEAEYMRFYTSNGVGNIDMIGTDPGVLTFQTAAHDGVGMFGGAEAGETQELKIYGYRTGDQKRSLDIGVGTDANDTASFDGVSNYFFDGNVTATTDVCVGSNCLSNMGGSSGWNTTGPLTYLSNTSGYVGIGTSSPQNPLDVIGNINSTDTIYSIQNESFVGVNEGLYVVPHGFEGGGTGWGFSTANANSFFRYQGTNQWTVDVYGQTFQEGSALIKGNTNITEDLFVGENITMNPITGRLNQTINNRDFEWTPTHNWTLPSRSFDVTYRNNLSKALDVKITGKFTAISNGSQCFLTGISNGTQVSKTGWEVLPTFPEEVTWEEYRFMSFTVEPNDFYSVSTTTLGSCTIEIEHWVEEEK